MINVVLYVKPKQRKVGVDGTGGAGADSFTRADSLGSGLGNDGEGTMAKLIKKQQILVGKGKAPRLFDRVTISEEFYQIYVSPVDLNRTGTIVGILKGRTSTWTTNLTKVSPSLSIVCMYVGPDLVV